MSRIKQIARSLLGRIRGLKKRGSLVSLRLLRAINQNRKGLNLIGYFSYTSGVAEVGRFFARFTSAQAIPFHIYDVEAPGYKKIDEGSQRALLPYLTRKTSYHKNIFFINADQINFIRQEHPALFEGRYNAAVFFWEFNDYFNFPEAFRVVDEVVAFTDFIATAVRKAAPPHIRVTKMPFPFSQNWTISKAPEVIRKEWGIAHDEYVFIFNFDFHSVYLRKNPEAIIKAFESVFTPSDKVRLIIKTIHAEKTNAHFVRFTSQLNNMKLREKVVVINDNLGRDEFMSMINACDCYVSLHRSEGLGLGMLEAMSMAKPVIGTNFGGNTDFMNDENSLLVNFTLVPVEAGAGPYREGWLWAEADVAQAAAYMRKLYEDRVFSRDIGLAAKRSVEAQYNSAVFGQFLSEWLQAT